MPDRVVQYIAIFAFAGIAVFLIVELVRWRSLGDVISRRQRMLRVALLAMFELFFAMLYGIPLVVGKQNPVIGLIYLTICILLVPVILIIAFADVREVIKSSIILQRRMISDLRRDNRRDK